MDPVRRQLKLLDARLAARESGTGRTFAYCPLLLPAAAFMVGILAENACAVSLTFISAIFVLTVGAVACSRTLAKPRTGLYLTAGATCAAFFCLGVLRLKCYYQPQGDDIRNLIANGRTLATIEGRVLTSPCGDDPDLWKFGRYNWMEAGCRFYVKAGRVRAGDGWAKVSGVVLVGAPAEAGYLRPGDCVRIQCWLDGFGGALNPGQFDLRQSMRRRNIHVAAAVESADAVRLLARAGGLSFAAALGGLREKTSNALLDETLAEDDASPVLAALLLGQRSDIDIETMDAFQKTNLAHFISLSGMHLGILAMTGWGLLRAAGLGRRWRAVVCVAAIGFYLLIVPVRAPTLRAAVICWTFFLSILFARKANPLNTLAIAVIAGLLIRPADIFTAGWQLSYTTVLGIILFQRPLANWVLERTADPLYVRVKDSRAVWLLAPFGWLVNLFTVGLAAWLGGSGILLYHFGSVGPMASVWTVFVFPLVWGILVLGFAKILLTPLVPTVALLSGVLLSLLGSAFVVSVKFLAGVGFSEVRIGQVSGLFVVGYYVLMMGLRFGRLRVPLYRRLFFAFTVAAILLPLVLVKYARTHRNDLEMTSLAVGHGQAIFLALPGGGNALFDAGSLSSRNCGWRTVVPFLRHKGVGRINDLIISHDDIDHINGIPEIVATVQVDHIRTSSAVLAAARTVSTAGYLNNCLNRLGREIEPLGERLACRNGVAVKTLWPPADVCQDTSISDNDKSLVLLIEYAGRRVLLCSDIELYGQEQILARNPDLRADVVVMPHHGSTTNLVEGFVERLGARTVVANCSESRYAAAYRPPEGVVALYTPVDGAATVTIKADGTLNVSGLLGADRRSSTDDPNS